MKNKWLLIAIALLAIGIAIWFFAARSGSSDTTPTTTNSAIQAPVQTPAQTAPATINQPAPVGVVEITAEKLTRELVTNWTKYKRGTIFQVSGVFVQRGQYRPDLLDSVQFSIGPVVKTSVGNLYVNVDISYNKEPETLKAFDRLKVGEQVVIRGTYFTFDNSNEGGVILTNVSLISPKK